jgi:hypothetical protein
VYLGSCRSLSSSRNSGYGDSSHCRSPVGNASKTATEQRLSEPATSRHRPGAAGRGAPNRSQKSMKAAARFAAKDSAAFWRSVVGAPRRANRHSGIHHGARTLPLGELILGLGFHRGRSPRRKRGGPVATPKGSMPSLESNASPFALRRGREAPIQRVGWLLAQEWLAASPAHLRPSESAHCRKRMHD